MVYNIFTLRNCQEHLDTYGKQAEPAVDNQPFRRTAQRSNQLSADSSFRSYGSRIRLSYNSDIHKLYSRIHHEIHTSQQHADAARTQSPAGHPNAFINI